MIIFRNLISIYLDPKSPYSTRNLKEIPLIQILNLAANIATYPIQYVNEVLLKVLLDKINPSQKFSFVKEIKKVSGEGFDNLTNFKKIHYQKHVITRMRAMPKVKGVRKELERLNLNHIKYCRGSEVLTKFTRHLKFFRKYIGGVIYNYDKFCMVTLRDMLNMKMMSDLVRHTFSFLPASDIMDWSEVWPVRTKITSKAKQKSAKEIDGAETNSILAPRSAGSINQFFGIVSHQHPQEDCQDNENRSQCQFSDFSMKYNHGRKMSEDFFDF